MCQSRRFVKRGAEFAKEVAAAMNERAELEAGYAKGLAKVSGRRRAVFGDTFETLSAGKLGDDDQSIIVPNKNIVKLITVP